jgi:hypothetical protein
VNFSPEGPGQHAGEFVLICDNCTVRQLRLVGRGSEVAVQLVEIDGRHLQQEDAQSPVWFGQVSMADKIATVNEKPTQTCLDTLTRIW